MSEELKPPIQAVEDTFKQVLGVKEVKMKTIQLNLTLPEVMILESYRDAEKFVKYTTPEKAFEDAINIIVIRHVLQSTAMVTLIERILREKPESI